MKKEPTANETNECVAEAIYDLSKSIRLLGSGNIARDDTTPGSLEKHTIESRDSSAKIAEAIESVSDASRDIAGALSDIAEAINNLAQAFQSKGK